MFVDELDASFFCGQTTVHAIMDDWFRPWHAVALHAHGAREVGGQRDRSIGELSDDSRLQLASAWEGRERDIDGGVRRSDICAVMPFSGFGIC